MDHSVTFGDKNTWTDWKLIPSSLPVINTPAPKVSMIDIPGKKWASGYLYYSQSSAIIWSKNRGSTICSRSRKISRLGKTPGQTFMNRYFDIFMVNI